MVSVFMEEVAPEGPDASGFQKSPRAPRGYKDGRQARSRIPPLVSSAGFPGKMSQSSQGSDGPREAAPGLDSDPQAPRFPHRPETGLGGGRLSGLLKAKGHCPGAAVAKTSAFPGLPSLCTCSPFVPGASVLMGQRCFQRGILEGVSVWFSAGGCGGQGKGKGGALGPGEAVLFRNRDQPCPRASRREPGVAGGGSSL